MAENIKKEELGFKGVRRIEQKTKVDVPAAETRVEFRVRVLIRGFQ